jgi:hypothetical protein
MMIQMSFNGGVVGIPYARGFDVDSGRHEFLDLRRYPGRIDELPEPKRWPELKQFLVQVNRADGRFFTIGCECADSSDGNFTGGMTHKITSYVQVAFANLGLANSEDAYFILVGRFFKLTANRDKAEPLILDFTLEQFGFSEQNFGGMCLCIWVNGFGMNMTSTRAIWADGLAAVREFLCGESDKGIWPDASQVKVNPQTDP